MRPIIGKLNVIATIQESITQADGQGGHKLTGWKTILRVWGEVRQPKPQFTDLMGGAAGIIDVPFMIRPNYKVKVGQRLVIYGNEIYDIINIWTNYRDEMILTCRKSEFNGTVS